MTMTRFLLQACLAMFMLMSAVEGGREVSQEERAARRKKKEPMDPYAEMAWNGECCAW